MGNKNIVGYLIIVFAVAFMMSGLPIITMLALVQRFEFLEMSMHILIILSIVIPVISWIHIAARSLAKHEEETDEHVQD